MYGFVLGLVLLFGGTGLAAGQFEWANDWQLLGVLLMIVGLLLIYLFWKQAASHWKLGLVVVLLMLGASITILWMGGGVGRLMA